MPRRIIALALAMLLVTAATCKGETGMTSMNLSGPMGQRFDADVDQWLLTAPYVNPGMLEQYFQRNSLRAENLVPWYGEFSGKYLTSAALSYRMKPSAALRKAADYVVRQLALAQSPDGYLGVWPDDQKLQGKNASGHKTWDAWSHYHNMLGLYLWYKATGSEEAWNVCLKAASCLYDFYITQGHALDEDKDGTDAAVGHAFSLLYEETGDGRWLEMVKACFAAFESEKGGDYFNAGLSGKKFFQMKRTRWECLHAIEAIYEMYSITGDEDYKTAFENIWWSICLFDRHNTGGFSSGESATGNPYDTRAIETCCTVAWMALSVDMLRLTEDPYVADELELATWNGLMGAQNATGRSFTYNTPMMGVKKASSHDIVFQAVAGSYELNCCSVNGPRGFGMIGQWGALTTEDEITLNYYGTSETEVELGGGRRVTLVQEGSYPFGDRIKITIKSPDGFNGVLKLRIPFWSRDTSITVNGVRAQGVESRSYYAIPSVKDGDVIEMVFDMSPHFWQGDLDLGGKTSIYCGPILLTYDQRFNAASYQDAPKANLNGLTLDPVKGADNLYPAPLLLFKVVGIDGRDVLLCDFASAGQTGTAYTTWIPSESPLDPPGYSKSQPMWGQTID